MNFAICLVLLIAIGFILSRLSIREVPPSARVTIGSAIMVLSMLLAWFFTTTNIAIPGTDATIADAGAMVRECEATLPRNQKCEIDLQVHPADSVDKD